MLDNIMEHQDLEKVVEITPLEVVDNSTQTDNEIRPDYLPLEFVKEYLRIDHDLDDAELKIFIKSAQNYVRDYTKTPDDEEMSFSLLPSILCLVAHFYENKGALKKATENLDVIFGSTLDMNRQDIL